MDPRLQKAIGAPRILGQADQLVTLALRALDDLKRLDESLYLELTSTDQRTTRAAAPARAKPARR